VADAKRDEHLGLAKDDRNDVCKGSQLGWGFTTGRVFFLTPRLVLVLIRWFLSTDQHHIVDGQNPALVRMPEMFGFIPVSKPFRAS